MKHNLLNIFTLTFILIFITGCQSGCNSGDNGYYQAGQKRTYYPSPGEGEPIVGDPQMNELNTNHDDGHIITDSRMQQVQMPRIFFAYDQFNIPQQEQEKLVNLGNYLLEYSYIGIRIEGHCDERGSVEYNRSLGERRALAVKDYLNKMGVGNEKMQTISYGEEKLLDTADTKEGHAKNRRVEFVIGKLR